MEACSNQLRWGSVHPIYIPLQSGLTEKCVKGKKILYSYSKVGYTQSLAFLFVPCTSLANISPSTSQATLLVSPGFCII